MLGLLAAFCAFLIVSVGEAASTSSVAPTLRTGLAPQSAGPEAQVQSEADPRRNVRVVYPGLVASR